MMTLIACEDCWHWHPPGTCDRDGPRVNNGSKDRGRAAAEAYWNALPPDGEVGNPAAEKIGPAALSKADALAALARIRANRNARQKRWRDKKKGGG